MSVPLAVCVTCVWVSWTVHDALQEHVFRVPGFRFGVFMAFVLQAVSFCLSGLQSAVCACWSPAQPGARRERGAWPCAEEAEEAALLSGTADSGGGGGGGGSGGGGAGRSRRLQALGYYVLLSALIAGANGTATCALNFVSMQMKVRCPILPCPAPLCHACMHACMLNLVGMQMKVLQP